MRRPLRVDIHIAFLYRCEAAAFHPRFAPGFPGLVAELPPFTPGLRRFAPWLPGFAPGNEELSDRFVVIYRGGFSLPYQFLKLTTLSAGM